MLRPLILLFGHENSPSGQLSDVAISRCDVTLGLLNQHPNAVVLPTGGFGAHFNVTERMHSSYLADYLLTHGVDGSRILSGTSSSNTLEDCLCARKVVVDEGFSPIIAVTSEYHAPRVRLILNSVFRALQFSVEEAQTPAGFIDGEKQKEARSFAWLRRNWVHPPLYEKGAEFPETVYEASAQDQRHYDTVSLAAVTGAVVVAGLLFQSAMTVTSPSLKSAMYLFGALLDLVLLIVYERCAATARTARRSMRLTEIAFDSRGFSSSYEPLLLFRWLPSIQATVRYLFAALLLILATLAVLSMMGK